MSDDKDILSSQESRQVIAQRFIGITLEIADRVKWNQENILISKQALSGALAESAKDVHAIIQRRNHGEISTGKLAGIVTFRLSRWHPIHLAGDLAENPKALKLNTLVPFALCLKHFLNVNIARVPALFTKEFQYTLLRRHTNQETLGLAYDMLDHHVTTVPTEHVNLPTP